MELGLSSGDMLACDHLAWLRHAQGYHYLA